MFVHFVEFVRMHGLRIVIRGDNRNLSEKRETRCCGFAAVGPVSRYIDRLLTQRRSAGECEQCNVFSIRR